MPVRKISAKDFANDVKAGLHNAVLMEKYKLSHGQLEGLLAKLRRSGLLENHKREHKAAPAEVEPEFGFECPKCGQSQLQDFSQCPECGAPKPGKDTGPGVLVGAPLTGGTGVFQRGPAPDPEKIREALSYVNEDQETKGLLDTERVILGVVLLVVTALCLILGPNSSVTSMLTWGLTVYTAIYFIVILLEAFQDNFLWGLFLVLFPPAAVVYLFVRSSALHERSIFALAWLGSILVILILYAVSQAVP